MKWASFFHTGLKTHFKFLRITEGIFFFTSLFVNGHMLYFSLWSGCTQMDISMQMHAPLHVDAYIHVYVQFTSSNMYVLHGRLDKFTLKIKFSFQFSFSYIYIFFFYCGGEKMLIFYFGTVLQTKCYDVNAEFQLFCGQQSSMYCNVRKHVQMSETQANEGDVSISLKTHV